MFCLTITLHPEDVGRQPQKTTETVVIHAIAQKKMQIMAVVSAEVFRVSIEDSHQFHPVSLFTSLHKLLTCAIGHVRFNIVACGP